MPSCHDDLLDYLDQGARSDKRGHLLEKIALRPSQSILLCGALQVIMDFQAGFEERRGNRGHAALLENLLDDLEGLFGVDRRFHVITKIPSPGLQKPGPTHGPT